MWAGTDLGPADVDVAQLYDGFSSMTLCWLEDLGFVKKGEAGAFFAEGRGRLGGDLPVCTDGGHLGGGRLHGFGKLAEAVKQLRGECGERQVQGAEVALACVGGGAIASSMLLVAG
jgi:acetyl-CoA acetyltransferase